jgi:aryl-alcohol dehydrogenase-like predicted oxidoreductase
MSKISTDKFILGTVQMGLNYGINNTSGKVSLEDSHEILEYAFDHGIRILDSAEAYGNAHDVIGTFHKAQPNKSFDVITKLPHHFDAEIKERVATYLNHLHVEQLHALLFHSFDSYKKNIKNFDALLELKAQKKIKHIGVSVYTNEEIEDVILDDNVEIIQLPFNLLDNNALRSQALKKAKSKGKIIHTRSAFLQGLFFKAMDSENQTVKQLHSELNQLSAIKNRSKITMSQLALNYCLQQDTIDNVLIGVDSRKQLIENIEALNSTVSPEIIDEINSIKAQNIDLLNPSLWS